MLIHSLSSARVRAHVESNEVFKEVMCVVAFPAEKGGLFSLCISSGALITALHIEVQFCGECNL